ncbi:MAG: S24/S26 family peptidase [Pseudomonadota bacterium]
MKSRKLKPALLIKKREELPILGPALIDLLRAVLDKEALFRFRAKGFSMVPFIKDDDVVTVSPLWGGSPGVGDVVAFVSPYSERLVVHRVVGKKGDHYLIKGDSAREPDGLVPRINILGRVRAVERNGKEILLGLGPERVLIARLTRNGLILNLLLPIWRLIRPIARRWAT